MLAKNGKVLFALISATACSITVTLSITSTSSAPALSEVMLASARHIKDVLAGASLTDCLSRTPAPLRAAAQAHSFYCLRHLGLAQQLRKKLVPREPKDPLLNALMLQALLLVDVAVQVQADRHCFDDRPEVPVYSVHTVVDQAVEAAQSVRALRPFKALLNAVLRRFIRERQDILSQALKFPEAQWNHPEWWINTLKKAYPQNWQSILAVTAIPAPLTLRVNQRRCSVARLLALLEQADIDAWSPGANTVVLAKARPVHQIPAFDLGWWSVQDASAQRAGDLLPIKDGMRVLDACAAPGGKTAHLLERADIDLLALDSDAKRLERVVENVDRLGLNGDHLQIKAAFAQHLDQWWDGHAFDAILADVPCTASGIVRRHPDIRWLRRPSDIAATATLQRDILQKLWSTLKPGGHLLYVTCSIFPQEGQQQIDHFLVNHADALLLPQSPLQILPQVDTPEQAGGDGFFYALLQKRL